MCVCMCVCVHMHVAVMQVLDAYRKGTEVLKAIHRSGLSVAEAEKAVEELCEVCITFLVETPFKWTLTAM